MTSSGSVLNSSQFLFAVIASAALSACGGGGGGTAGGTSAGGAATASEVTGTASISNVPTTSSILSLIPVKGSATATASTSSTIVVTALGSPAGGVGPIMQVYVDGRLLGSSEVTGSDVRGYTFTAPATTAAAKVDVVFTNDAFVGGQDRNLYVVSINIDGTTYLPTDAGFTYDRGAGAAAFDGIDAIAGQVSMFWGGALRFTTNAPLTTSALAASGGFYVDAANGNDSNPGTIAAPWQTLAKLTSIKMAAGDGIYLKCGSIWHEALTLDGNQLVDGAVIAGYGDCSTSKATISGAVSMAGGWTRNGNVWSRAVPAGTAKIARLYIDDQAYRVARWPNFTNYAGDLAIEPGTAPKSPAVLQVDSAARTALQGINLVGATLQVRSTPWEIETRTIASYAADGSIVVNTPTTNPMMAGAGYMIQDKLALLDAPGEFFHDTSTNRLYVYPRTAAEQADMNSAGVEATSRNQTLKLMSGRNLVVRDLQFTMSTGDGLVAWNTPGIKIDNVVASRNISSGISLAIFDTNITTTGRSSVSNSVLYENWNYGIDGRYMPLFDLLNSKITDTGTVDNSGWSQAAVAVGPSASVTGNTIDTSAFHGINFSGTGGSVVSNNYLNAYCARLTDCGGIYTWNAQKSAINRINQSSTVQGNQLLPVTPNARGAAGGSNDLVAGIYLDDYTQGVTVKGNWISGVPIGLFLHNVSNSTVTQNAVWFASGSALNASMDQTDADYMTGNVFSENEFVRPVTATGNYPGLPTVTAAQTVQFGDGFSQMNALRSNTFRANRHIDLTGTTVQLATISGSGSPTLTAADWSALNPADTSLLMPAVFATSAMVLGPELVPGGDFSSGLGSWYTYFGSNAGSAQYMPSLAGCTGGCMQLTAGTRGDQLFSRSFSMTPGVPHIYTYTATYGGTATVGDPYISRAGTPWDQMQDGSGFVSLNSRSLGAAGTTSTYLAYFIPKSSDPAQVNLQVWNNGVPVAFDNVSIKAITGFNFSNRTDWAQSLHAPRSGTLTVDCAALGWATGCSALDINGTPVALPYTLAAGTSKLFLRADSTWRR